MKIQSQDIPHKSQAGGVVLNVSGNDAVEYSFHSIQSTISENHPTAKIEGILVQEMSEPGLEMILGINNNDGFGPILMAGFGGVDVEKSRDVAFAPIPLDKEGCYQLLSKLRGAAILDEDKYDVPALVELMEALSTFGLANRKSIGEVDLNPVLLHSKGYGVTVIDALMFKTNNF